MKQTVKRTLAMVLALMMALSAFSMAEEPEIYASSVEEPVEETTFFLDDDPASEPLAARADENGDQDAAEALGEGELLPEGVVRVSVDPTPAEAVIAIYAQDDETPFEDQLPIEPQLGADWLLAPGKYAYSAWAEGYVSAERVPFEVTEQAEPLALEILLEQAEAMEESAEEVIDLIEDGAETEKPSPLPADAETTESVTEPEASAPDGKPSAEVKDSGEGPDPVVIEQTIEVEDIALASGADESVSVHFSFKPEDALLEVFDSDGEFVFPEEENLYLLPPGSYTYKAEADGYVSVENEPFEVVAGQELSIAFSLDEAEKGDTPEPSVLCGSWRDLQTAVNAAQGDVLSLGTDLCAENEGASALVIPVGASVTIDLNGCTLSRKLSGPASDGCVIIVNGALTLTDRKKGGAVTGGRNSGNGGGVCVAAGGSLTLDGAVIEGNRSEGMGGGVYAAGSFTMKKGSISDNTATTKGGGVFFESAFAMEGGSLSENEPEDVCLDRPVTISGAVGISCAFIPTADADYSFLVSDKLEGADIRLSVPEDSVGKDGVRVTRGLDGRGALENFRMRKSGDCDVALDAGEAVIYKYATVTLYAGDGTGMSKEYRVVGGEDFILPNGKELFDAPEGQPFTAWLMGDKTLKKADETIHVTESLSATAQWAINWADLQQMIDSAQWDGEVRLPGGVVRGAEDENACLTIPADKKITLDLAGFALDGAGIGDKAVIYVKGQLTLTDSVGGGRVTGGSAGGVVVEGGSFTLQNGEISGNSSKELGGGVLVKSGSFTLEGKGVVSGNTAVTGGGVGVEGGSFTMKQGRVSDNTAKADGGGVAVTGGSFILEGGLVGGSETAASDGSASWVGGNSAVSGGGVSVRAGARFEMVREGAVSGNNTSENGGGLLLEKGATVLLTSGTIAGNTANGQGGGIYAEKLNFESNGVSITQNRAALGGGIADNAGVFTLKSGSISLNTAKKQGGGLYIVNSEVQLHGGSILANKAEYGGGAFIREGALIMPENVITGNTAVSGGAGVAFSNMKARLSGVACVRNNKIDGDEANYWLQDGATFVVNEPLKSSYLVYVSAEIQGRESRIIASGEKLIRDNFISVDPRFVSSRTMSGDILLGVPLTVHFTAGEGSGVKADDTTVKDGVYILPEADEFTAPSGLELLGWKIIKDGYWDKTTKGIGASLAIDEKMLDADGALNLEAQWGNGMRYVDENGSIHIAPLVIPLKRYAGQSKVVLDTGWYLADGTSFDVPVTVSGDVNIIIDNEHTTTMKAGIAVPAGERLSVWAMGGWETASGKLIAFGGDAGRAGIGGAFRLVPGRFDLHSGVVEATGAVNAAGVGGGDSAYGGTVVIHGGKLTARGGQNGAGIGGGMSASQGGQISIYGGTVNAYGGSDAAGIGGGKYSDTVTKGKYGGDGAQVTISDATVVAQGGQNGAGIGGGYGGSGGIVSIAVGSVVTAVAGKNPYETSAENQPQAIGRGCASRSGLEVGKITLSDDCVVEAGNDASNTETYASKREEACRKIYAKITSTERSRTVFSLFPEDVDTRQVKVETFLLNDLSKVRNTASFRDRIAVKLTLQENYYHYGDLELTYSHDGEIYKITGIKDETKKYQGELDKDTDKSEKHLFTFEMPDGDVFIKPIINTDSHDIFVNVANREGGSVYVSVDGEVVQKAPVGKEVHINCLPADGNWFLDVQQEEAQDKSTYEPYVTYQENGKTVVITTPNVDNDHNVRSFTMVPHPVTIDVSFLRIRHYYDENGILQEKYYYHTLTGNETEIESKGKAGGWYYADRSLTFSNRVRLKSEINLILGPNVTLTFEKGLRVAYDDNAKLYLYEEVKGGGSKLIADASSLENCAGIGGNDDETGGDVVICGGNVEAKGGYNAAGIGGGNHAGLQSYEQYGGEVTAKGGKYGAGIGGGEGYGGIEEEGIKDHVLIEGGELTATGGQYAAGIGGGQSMHQGKRVIIKGGKVYAKSNRDGAGIGGGEEFAPLVKRQVGGNGGEVYVSGGYVEAHGGGGDGGAGIGGGQDGKGGTFVMTAGTVKAYGGSNSAGIGGGHKDGGKVTISGGDVHAEGGVDAAGIGGGDWGKAGTIEISGGNVYAKGGKNGAGIGGGDRSDGGTIKITGGVIKAIGGNDATGVGGGSGTFWTFSDCGRVDSISFLGCNLYAYGGAAAVGFGTNASGKTTSFRWGTGGTMHVGDTYGGSTTLVTEDKSEAFRTHKYMEYIWCTNHTLGKTILGYEYKDNYTHIAKGLCRRCKGMMEVEEEHEWDTGKCKPVDRDKHNWSYQCKHCGAIENEREAHRYNDGENQCFDCGYRRSDVIVRILPADLKDAEPIELKMPFNTTYTLPDLNDLPWKTDQNLDGWTDGKDVRAVLPCGFEYTLEDDTTFTAAWSHVHEGITFHVWTATDRLPMSGFADGLDFYLLNDVVLKEPWEPKYIRNLCLNGHTITADFDDAIILNSDITIWDDGGGRIVNRKGNGVVIKGRYNDVTLKGGTISAAGDGVRLAVPTNKDYLVYSTFNMKGGAIEDCGGCGLRVSNNGIFNLSGGTISGCDQGGVIMPDRNFREKWEENRAKNEFNMTGGSITGNRTDGNGGGVLVGDNCTFRMSGGSITGNTAAGNGGGVYVGASGRFLIAGSPEVSGNSKGGTANNVYLPNNVRIGMFGDLEKESKYVYVTTEAKPSDGVPVVLTQGLAGKGLSRGFRSDDPAYSIRRVDGEAVMGVFSSTTVRFDANGGGGSMPDVTWLPGKDLTLPECAFTPPGHLTFGGWSLNGASELLQPGEVLSENDNITLKAVWQDIHDGLVFEPWEASDRLPGRGNYYLTQDVTLNKGWDFYGDLNLCLNGHSITAGHKLEIELIGVYFGGKLDIYDLSGTGTIEDGNTPNCINVSDDSTFTLHGGNIRGCVNCSSTKPEKKGGSFDLKGGTVYGANIPGKSNMNMSGGSVIKDGVNVAGCFTMTGGTITGSSTGVVVKEGAEFTLTGGTITGCTSAGVSVNKGSEVTLTGGTVTGNTLDGKPCNVQLAGEAKLKYSESSTIDPGARFGITTVVRPAVNAPVAFTQGLQGRDVQGIFTADSEDQTVAVAEGGEAELRTVKDGDPEDVPRFMTHSLLLTGEIGVNFFMELPEGQDFSDAYMEFTVQSKDGATTRDDLDPDDRDMNGNGYYGFTVTINAIQMAAPIRAVFHYGDGETVEQTYSVKDYIKSYDTVANFFDDSTTAMIHALADYGHYAQIILASVNGWTIGKDYADMDVFYSQGYDYEAVRKAVSSYRWVRKVTNIAGISIDLNLLSKTTMRLLFRPANASREKYIKFMTLDKELAKPTKLSDGRYFLEVPGIPAHRYNKTYVAGCIRDTVEFSVLSYVEGTLNSEALRDKSAVASEALKDCVCALYYYYKTVTDYRAAHGY